MRQEKFWIESKGGAVRWIPTQGFYIGVLNEGKEYARRAAEEAGVKYPCIIVMDGRNAVEIHHTTKDYSQEGV